MTAAAWIAIALGVGGIVGGLFMGWAAIRKIQPETQKLVLEGRSQWTLAETNYFDRLAERQDAESARLRAQIDRLQERLSGLESLEEQLKQERQMNAELRKALREALEQVHNQGRQIANLESRLTELEP